MRRSLAVHAVHTILAVLLTRVLGVMIFINPPPIGPLDDFSHNPIYPVGSTVEVQWTRGVPDQGVSLTFFQMNGTHPTNPLEYIIRMACLWYPHTSSSSKLTLAENALNATSFLWIVATTKNLSVSNMFILSVFQEGNTVADANSHYFNISQDSTQTGTTPVSASSTLTTAGSTHSVPVPIASTSISPSAESSSGSGGLSPGAQAGIGIGILCAVALGVAAGWSLFGRRNRRHDCAHAKSQPRALQAGYYDSGRPAQLTPKLEMQHLSHPVPVGRESLPEQQQFELYAPYVPRQ